MLRRDLVAAVEVEEGRRRWRRVRVEAEEDPPPKNCIDCDDDPVSNPVFFAQCIMNCILKPIVAPLVFTSFRRDHCLR